MRQRASREGRCQSPIVARRVRAGKAVDSLCRTVVGAEPRKGACGPHEAYQPVRPDLQAHLLVRDRAAADRGQQASIRRDQGDIGLGVAAVDTQDVRFGHTAMSASTRTNSAPASRSRATIPGSASWVGSGQPWHSTMAPSP